MKESVRESNFELMRIVSMFLIVLFHTLAYSNFAAQATGGMKLLLTFIKALTLVHVNSFILISGYFQCKGKLKLGKVMTLVNATWFYKVVILLLCLGFGWLAVRPDNTEILRTLLPLDYGIYWFIGNYIVLYLISPILNIIINHTEKKQLRNVIAILFLIVSVLSLVTGDMFYNNNYGRSLTTFILLYFIGGYLRNYPIDKSYFFKPFTTQAKRTTYIMTIGICAIVGTLCYTVSCQLINLGSIASECGKILDYLASSYSSPIVLLQTVCYFLLFASFSFKKSWINKISGCMIGVYLIHENIYVRENLYNYLGLTKITEITPSCILILLGTALGIFLLATVIEFIRKKIFKLIYNTKLAKKNRQNYQNYVKELGIQVNW